MHTLPPRHPDPGSRASGSAAARRFAHASKETVKSVLDCSYSVGKLKRTRSGRHAWSATCTTPPYIPATSPTPRRFLARSVLALKSVLRSKRTYGRDVTALHVVPPCISAQLGESTTSNTEWRHQFLKISATVGCSSRVEGLSGNPNDQTDVVSTSTAQAAYRERMKMAVQRVRRDARCFRISFQ